MKCPALKMGWHHLCSQSNISLSNLTQVSSAVASEEGALIEGPEEKEKTVLIILMLQYLCSILLIKVIS